MHAFCRTNGKSPSSCPAHQTLGARASSSTCVSRALVQHQFSQRGRGRQFQNCGGWVVSAHFIWCCGVALCFSGSTDSIVWPFDILRSQAVGKVEFMVEGVVTLLGTVSKDPCCLWQHMQCRCRFNCCLSGRQTKVLEEKGSYLPSSMRLAAALVWSQEMLLVLFFWS